MKALRCKIAIDRAYKKSSPDAINHLVSILESFFEIDKFALVVCKNDIITRAWTEAGAVVPSEAMDLSKDMRKISFRTALGKAAEITEMLHNLDYIPELVTDCKHVYSYRTETERVESDGILCYFFGFKESNMFRLLFKE